MTSPLRLGTRGSRLALWQAHWVRDLISALPDAPPVEIVEIETSGDRIQNVPLSQAGGRDFFTKDIETALQEGRIDLAVHSLKDLATRLPEGLALGAVLKREDPTDALVSADGAPLSELPEGARIGTSSLRRRAFLNHLRPDVRVVGLRGNVPTRLRKLETDDYDAVVLATAGLVRLGYGDRITERLDPSDFTPAPAQGAVGIEIRKNDARTGEWVAAIEDPVSRMETTAERALLRTLEGGCSVPIGALARVTGGHLHLHARVASLDGTDSVAGSLEGPPSEAFDLGEGLARQLAEGGATAILDAVRATAS